MTERVHLNNFATTLNGAITDVATTIVVTDATGLPTTWTDTEVRLTLTNGTTVEIITVTDRTGNSLTATRGQEGTSGFAFADLDDVELRTTADSLDRKIDLTSTQSINLSNAEDLKIPNGASFAAAAAGEIGVDTTITDHTGLIKYHDGVEELSSIAVPTADLTTTDGHIVAYNATNNQFEMVAPAGGGGIVVQQVTSLTTTSSSGTGTIAWDNSIPQNTEGDELMTLAITPTSATNRLIITFDAMMGASAANMTALALFQDATANALYTTTQYMIATLQTHSSFTYSMIAGTTSATTFKVRAGASGGAGTTYFLTTGAGLKYGATPQGTLIITEVTV